MSLIFHGVGVFNVMLLGFGCFVQIASCLKGNGRKNKIIYLWCYDDGIFPYLCANHEGAAI